MLCDDTEINLIVVSNFEEKHHVRSWKAKAGDFFYLHLQGYVVAIVVQRNNIVSYFIVSINFPDLWDIIYLCNNMTACFGSRAHRQSNWHDYWQLWKVVNFSSWQPFKFHSKFKLREKSWQLLTSCLEHQPHCCHWMLPVWLLWQQQTAAGRAPH